MYCNKISRTFAIDEQDILRLYIDGKLIATHSSWLRLVNIAKHNTTGNFTILDNNNNIQ